LGYGREEGRGREKRIGPMMSRPQMSGLSRGFGIGTVAGVEGKIRTQKIKSCSADNIWDGDG
jgi:hypothetical protein